MFKAGAAFQPGMHVFWASASGNAHTFHGVLVQRLSGGLWMVDDGTGRPPRPVSESRMTKTVQFSRGGWNSGGWAA